MQARSAFLYSFVAQYGMSCSSLHEHRTLPWLLLFRRRMVGSSGSSISGLGTVLLLLTTLRKLPVTGHWVRSTRHESPVKSDLRLVAFGNSLTVGPAGEIANSDAAWIVLALYVSGPCSLFAHGTTR